MNSIHLSSLRRKVSGGGLKWSSFLILSAVLITSGFFIYNVLAAATITPATGGENISIDTTTGGGSGAYTNLGGPIIQEGTVGDISLGFHTITLPIGWEFNTLQNVTIGIGGTTELALSAQVVTPLATTLSFNI